MANILTPDEIDDIRASVAPELGDELVSLVEVWRKPAAVEGVVPGGGGVDKYGYPVDEGTAPSRPDQRYAPIAEYPARITRAGTGNEQEFGGQYVAVAPWTLAFNWADNPDIAAADKLIVARSEAVDGEQERLVWTAGEVIVIGDIRQPVTSNGRYYRATVAGTTHTSEPAWPLTPIGATVVDGGVTWTYVDKLRTFEVKDAGGEGTFKIVRLVRCDEVKP